jgi:anti-sigma B factor antagonist
MRLVETPEEMRVTVAEVGDGTRVVTVTGELDLYSAPGLRERLWPVAEHATGTVIVDLSGVAFIDSTALGVLAAAAKLMRESGTELVVASGDPRLHRLLEITGLLGLIRTERTLAEAVEHSVAG